MLEVLRQEHLRELGNVPDDEAVVPAAPRNNLVGGKIINHVVGFAQERRHRLNRRRYRRRV